MVSCGGTSVKPFGRSDAVVSRDSAKTFTDGPRFLRDRNMNFDITSLAIGLLTGSIVTIAIANPRVGRIVARALASIAVAAGVGLVIWGIAAMTMDVGFSTVEYGPVIISEPIEVLGLGGGLLIGGIMVLVLSMLGKPNAAH